MNSLQPGQQLGPYQVISQIGQGGMASVYKAYHPAMDRYVALKIISSDLSGDPNFLKRFQQEARLIARLEHPHILPIHDFGEANSIPYMVMRFLEAGTLKEKLDSGPLELPEIDRIFNQLADALQYAHQNGVIHRDIKPSNAMLDKRGVVFLTDFGVAKMMEGTSQLTATGAITGTPAYMSPEQAQGQPIDQRSDIYSLGIVLFEMLTGHVPFEAETPLAVLFKQIQDPPPPLSTIRPDLPYSLEMLLLRAMAKNREERFETVDDFLDAWKQAIVGIRPPGHQTIRPEAGQTVKPASSLAPEPVAAQIAPNPPVPPRAMDAAPVPKKKTKPDWIIPGIIGVVVMALLTAGFWWVQRQLKLREWRQTYEATATAESNLRGSVAPITDNSNWTSWTGGNSIYSIAVGDGEIYTAGVGGLTIWNEADGSSQVITTRDGMPSAWADVLYLDPADDSLWIGTDNGLAHYLNGEIVETFDDNNGLDSNYVTGITRYKDQLIVATTYCGGPGCGLQTYDGSRWKPITGFPPSDDEPGEGQVSHNINVVMVDESAPTLLWVGTQQGLALLDDDNEWNIFDTSNGLENDAIFSLYADQWGNIWAGTGDGGLARFDWDGWAFNTIENLQEYDVYDLMDITEDANGMLWLASYHLARYDPSSGEITSFGAEAEYLHAIATGADGTIYIGSEGSGLLRYADDSFSAWSVPDALNYPSYNRIVPSGEGIYFVEMYRNGADYFDPPSGSFQWYPNTYEGSLPLADAPNGETWFGGYDGAWQVHGKDASHYTTRNGLPADEVHDIAVSPDGTVYISTVEGLAILRGQSVEKVIPPSELSPEHGPIRLLFAATDNTLWTASEDSVSIGHYTPANGQWQWIEITSELGVDPVQITGFAENPRGGLLVASDGNGLYQLKDGEWGQILSTDPGVQLPNDYITCIVIAPDNSAWMATDSEGVARFDGENWTTYTMEDGLSDNTVYDIYFSPTGEIWFATRSGITRLTP